MVRKGYERVIVWEISWRLNKDCNMLTPSSSGYSSTSFSSCRAAHPASAGTWFSLLRTATTDSKLWSPTNWLPVAPGYIIVCVHLLQWASHLHSIQPVSRQGYPLISSTGCTYYLHWCISYLTARPGRRSVCYIYIYSLFASTYRSIVHNKVQVA